MERHRQRCISSVCSPLFQYPHQTRRSLSPQASYALDGFFLEVLFPYMTGSGWKSAPKVPSDKTLDNYPLA